LTDYIVQTLWASLAPQRSVIGRSLASPNDHIYSTKMSERERERERERETDKTDMYNI